MRTRRQKKPHTCSGGEDTITDTQSHGNQQHRKLLKKERKRGIASADIEPCGDVDDLSHESEMSHGRSEGSLNESDIKDLSLKDLVTLSSSESSDDDDDLDDQVIQTTHLSTRPAHTLRPKCGELRVKTLPQRRDKPGIERVKRKPSKSTDTLVCEEGKGVVSTASKLSKSTDTSVCDESKGDISAASKVGKRRYILFVGNLPYSASREDVMEHFESRGVPVVDVRLATSKETGTSRGFCFLELSSHKILQNALKLHHTKMAGGVKRINVEVTCGGGGTGEARRKRIQEKNVRIQKQKRVRRSRGTTRDRQTRIAV